jgi:thioredoxin reductase
MCYARTSASAAAHSQIILKRLLSLKRLLQAFEKDGRYKNCRGVVASVSGVATYIQARITVVCTGCKPNSKLLQGVCTMMSNGAIIVDSALLTSKQHIYAAGGTSSIQLLLMVLLVFALVVFTCYKFHTLTC